MHLDDPKAIWRPPASEYYRDWPSEVKIDCVNLHVTALGLTGTPAWFANPDSEVKELSW